VYLSTVPVTIEPEPPEQEREAIVAALAGEGHDLGDWSHAALAEGVEKVDLDPVTDVRAETF
jgi:hypothetical protein